MHIVVETLQFLVLFLYSLIEGLVLLFVPSSVRQKDVSGKTVLVTGAGMGMGRLLCFRFADLGCKIVMWDINKKAMEDTAAELKETGAEVFSYVCDLSKRDDIYRVADQVKSDIGDVDILVNNAGIVTGNKFLQCPDGLIEKTMEVNTNAHFWTVKKFLPAMMAKDSGHIVSIASSAGLIGVTGLADYCASKHGAVGFDESLRFELDALGKNGIKTTVVCPYYINTGMFSGVKTRFPFLLPIVEPEYAVDRIVEAILTNKPILYIPRILYVVLAVKGILPVKSQLLMCKFFGINNCMDEFEGRAKKD